MASKPFTDDQARHALLAKVRINGDCWEWTGATKGNGYGHTSRGPAHRRSYALFVGEVPGGGVTSDNINRIRRGDTWKGY